MSPVSLHDLPEEIKRHIEDESLNVVEKLRASSISFILIGGWAARAIGGADHDRYTFDVDGVLGSNSDFDAIAVILSDEGMEVTKFDWGQTYSRGLKLPLNHHIFHRVYGFPAQPGALVEFPCYLRRHNYACSS
jgi:hypothetical protein